MSYIGTNKIGGMHLGSTEIAKAFIGSTLVYQKERYLTTSGVMPLTFMAKSGAVASLVRYGKCVQNGTPTPGTPVDIVCNNGVLKFDSVNQEIYADGTAETITITPGGSTATAEMLLKIGDYQDTQEVIGGVVTRNVAVKVLDGTENWNIVNGAYADGTHRIYTNDFGYNSNTNGISSHFVEAPLEDRDLPRGQQGKMYHSGVSFHLRATQFTSLNVAKQWLANKYANGTPVIVVYPLATPTIEQVNGQQMMTTNGSNTVSSTSEISGIEAEIKHLI